MGPFGKALSLVVYQVGSCNRTTVVGGYYEDLAPMVVVASTK